MSLFPLLQEVLHGLQIHPGDDNPLALATERVTRIHQGLAGWEWGSCFNFWALTASNDGTDA